MMNDKEPEGRHPIKGSQATIVQFLVLSQFSNSNPMYWRGDQVSGIGKAIASIHGNDSFVQKDLGPFTQGNYILRKKEFPVLKKGSQLIMKLGISKYDNGPLFTLSHM